MESFTFEIQHFICIVMFFAVCGSLLLGFPVAFTLAGTALIFAIGASLAGLMDFDRMFAYPIRIFGVMSTEGEVLIAVPLFVFMGVVLERARIAEELLDNMGRLFGPLHGGLTVSVSVVGAMLAASTGIVGATVITMGLLSLPTMLRRGYDPSLACGSICAAGTLGQIIPPSIILILLGSAISTAYSKAQTSMGIASPDTITVEDLFAGGVFPGLVLVSIYIVYQLVVAWLYPESSPRIPEEEGAALRPKAPKLIGPLAVGVIIAILVLAILGYIPVWQAMSFLFGGTLLVWGYGINSRVWLPTLIGGLFLVGGIFLAPSVLEAMFPGESLALTSSKVFLAAVVILAGTLYGILYNPWKNPFWHQMIHALFAPVILIIAVLGSILGGVASPTEAAAVGCLGAIWMAGYRLDEKHGRLIAISAGCFVVLLMMKSFVDMNPQRKDISTGEWIATGASAILALIVFTGTIVALARVFRARILHAVVRSTMEITVLVFVILIGASLFSLAFRNLGGEAMVEYLLVSLPGGAVGAMIVVMLVMFVMGFFLDFLEIMFIVVPIVAPVLLQMKMGDGQTMDPIWLGLMIAVNLQTSFLTPPFGFALFYLRGVAPKSVTTMQIYKGIVPFVIIQLCILVVLWFSPGLVTWFPHILYGR